MPKVLIIYYSKSGNTKKMAELIADGVRMGKNVEAEVKPVQKTSVRELLYIDGIVVGSPTYYGSMAAEIKKFMDGSVKFHGKLEGKVGGAFSSSANMAGGNETTIMSILQCWLIHGMVVQGSSKGDHYGPVAIGEPDERSKKLCLAYGRRIAKLVIKTRSARAQE